MFEMTHHCWKKNIRLAQLLVRPPQFAKGLKNSEFAGVQWPGLSNNEKIRWDSAVRSHLSQSFSRRIRKETPIFDNHPRPPSEPCVFRGLLTSAQGWRIDSFLDLLFDKRLHDAKFEVGTSTCDDADGEPGPVLVTGSDFFGNYINSREAAEDRNPLYIFDSSFDCDAPELLTMYEVPRLFRSVDALQCLDEEDYANWRWLLAGPARAGSAPHVDPAGTSAWNALLCGRKWWVIGEPGSGLLSRQSQRESETKNDETSNEALPNPDIVGWFLNELPRLRKQKDVHNGPKFGKRVFEFHQEAGEVVWVPAGWEHAVINLDFSVAITHNLVDIWPGRRRGQVGSNSALLTFVRHVRRKEPAFAKRFLARLRDHLHSSK